MNSTPLKFYICKSCGYKMEVSWYKVKPKKYVECDNCGKVSIEDQPKP